MATLEFLTKADLEQFKQELFVELRRPTFRAPLKKEQLWVISNPSITDLSGFEKVSWMDILRSSRMTS